MNGTSYYYGNMTPAVCAFCGKLATAFINPNPTYTAASATVIGATTMSGVFTPVCDEHNPYRATAAVFELRSNGQ